MILEGRTPPKKADCTIIIGQSNAVGYPQTGTPNETFGLMYLPLAYQGRQHLIRNWNNRQYQPFDAGTDFTFQDIKQHDDRWGIEVGLLQTAAKWTGRAQYFAKFAAGGIPISDFEASNPTALIWPHLSLGIIRIVQWFLDRGVTPKFRVVMLQGENDCAVFRPDNSGYVNDVRTVQQNFRSLHPSLANVPWLNCKIIPQSWYFYPTAGNVNAAFDTLATESSLNHSIDPNSFGLMVIGDYAHYDAPSLLKLGEGLFNYCRQNNL